MNELEELRQENADLRKRLKVYEKEKTIFSRRLKQARNEKGYTQEQLAKKLGIARITLTQYERAINEPLFQTLIKIADSLVISLDWLCGRSEKMKLE